MREVIQRVLGASVIVDDEVVAKIGGGLLVFLGVAVEDTKNDAILLAKKTAELRIFSDFNDKMNLSLLDVDGSVIVVSNFTLLADVTSGRRPSFIGAAKQIIANSLYEDY